MRQNGNQYYVFQNIQNHPLEFKGTFKRITRKKTNSITPFNHIKSLKSSNSSISLHKPQHQLNTKTQPCPEPKLFRTYSSTFQRFPTLNLNHKHPKRSSQFSQRLMKLALIERSAKIKKKFDINDFELGLSRSEDRYGKIYPARHKETGFICCIREINKGEIKKELQHFINITKIHLKLNHKNIASIYGIFEGKNSIYIVMEYIEEGILLSKVKTQKGLPLEKVQKYFINIITAIKYLHQSHLILRSLKPQSIGIIHNVCKLASLSQICHSSWEQTLYLGPIEYSPPQILSFEKHTFKSDIWSLGILFYELLTGFSPFQNKSVKEIIKQITTPVLMLKLPSIIPEKMKLLLNRMLCSSEKERITIFQIVGFTEEWEKND